MESAIIFEMNGSKPGTHGTRTNPFTIAQGRFNFTFQYGPKAFHFSTTLTSAGSYSGEIIGDVK